MAAAFKGCMHLPQGRATYVATARARAYVSWFCRDKYATFFCSFVPFQFSRLFLARQKMTKAKGTGTIGGTTRWTSQTYLFKPICNMKQDKFHWSTLYKLSFSPEFSPTLSEIRWLACFNDLVAWLPGCCYCSISILGVELDGLHEKGTVWTSQTDVFKLYGYMTRYMIHGFTLY